MESAVQVETSSPASAKQRVSKAGSSSWTGTRSTIRKSILSPYPIPGYQWMHSRDSGSRHSFHDPMLDQIQPNSLLLEAQTILSSSSSPRLPPTPMLAHPPSPAPCFSSMGATIPITKFPSAGSGIFEREAYIASALQLPLDLLTMVERPIDCLDSRSGLRNTANARRLGSPLSEGTGPRCIAQERSPSYGGDVLRKRQEQGQIRMNGDLGQNRRPQFLKSQTTAGVLVGRSHLREVGIGEVYTAAPLGQEQARVCPPPLIWSITNDTRYRAQ